MELNEIIEKLGSIEGITEEDKAMVKSKINSVEDMTKKLSLEEAKAKRILGEKKTTQTKLEELNAKVETMQNEGLTDVEKIKKDMEKIEKEKEKLQKAYEGSIEELKNTKRSYVINQVSGSLKFLDSIPKDIAELSVTSALDKVDDLDDKDAVDNAIIEFKKSHSSMLVADKVAVGSGGSVKSGMLTNQSTGDVTPDKQDMSERQEYLKKKRLEKSY